MCEAVTRRTDSLMMASEKNGPENEAAFTKNQPIIFRPEGANQLGSVAKQTDCIDPAHSYKRRSDGVGMRDAVKLAR